MKTVLWNGRSVEIEGEMEIGEGYSVVSAFFSDNDAELTEDEIKKLESDLQSELYDEAYVDMASNAYDSYKDQMKYGD